jgi:hypothetical protein
MAAEPNFRADHLEPVRDNAVLESSFDRRPERLSLTPHERANLPPDVLTLVSPMLTRDPATWTLDEVQAVTAALESANGSEAAASLRSRLLNLGSPVIRAHEDQYKPLADEVRRINEELVAARLRPNSTISTISRRMAELRVDGMKRRAGEQAAAEERERWRTNPLDPRVQDEVRAARDRAEREVELRRPQLLADEAAKDEAARVKRHNAKNRALHDRKAALVKVLRENNVTVPEEPRELVS